MVTLRRSLALGSAVALLLSSTLFAQQAPPAPRKLTNAEKKEIQTVIKMVDDLKGAAPTKNELALSWLKDDQLKAQGGKTFVPFNVSIDPKLVTGGTVSFYWRVISKDAPVAAPVDPKAKKEKPDAEEKRPEYAAESINNITLEKDAPSPLRISRAFVVAPGNYDVIVTVKEPTPEKPKKGAPEPKVSMLSQPITVRDFSGELSTSSVIVSLREEPLAAPLTPTQMGERPYAFGGVVEFIPSMDAKFSKKDELSVFFQVYNAKADAATNRPDVAIDYDFYVKQAGGEKFFNKTRPQALNAQTLPPTFDPAAGHQLQGGQAVPLASFPEGEYRLQITVTDKLDSNKKITRDVNFSVSGS